jgi:hypothetical protein
MKYFLLIIFTYYISASACDHYFYNLDQFSVISKKYSSRALKSISTKQRKIFLRKVNSISNEQKRLLLKLSSVLPESEILRGFRDLATNPKIFMRHGEFSSNKFLANMAKKGYARDSYLRAKEWVYKGRKNSIDFPKEFIESQTIQTASDRSFLKAYNEIHDLFNNNYKVYSRMQDLEEEILIRATMENPKFLLLSAEKKAIEVQDNMVRILEDTELNHGFISASDKIYASTVLENRSYSMVEWNDMLAKGIIFDDLTFKQGQISSAISESQRRSHGFYTHRIQWHVLMKDMEAFPARYANLNANKIFKNLGDNNFDKRIGLGANGSNTSWQYLFDNMGGGYHQPEVFRQLHDDYPILGVWL